MAIAPSHPPGPGHVTDNQKASPLMSEIICMWSGPRNLSTAMMRSFGSRPDCTIWDEPFFAPYLKYTGKAHPGRAETLARHETDPETVRQRCVSPVKTRYHFQKHMPHHICPEFRLDWAKSATHFFLIRNPARVIASYIKSRQDVNVDDLGFKAQIQLYDKLSNMTGRPPPVIDSFDILQDPEKALKALCAAIDIPFDNAMLSWSPGPRPEDGAWAPYWYHSVEKSSGFSPPSPDMPTLDARYHKMLKACQADYERLKDKKIKV